MELSHEQLRNQYVCSKHFSPEHFCAHKRIEKNAVPNIFGEVHIDSVFIDLQPQNTSADLLFEIDSNSKSLDVPHYEDNFSKEQFLIQSSNNYIRIINNLNKTISDLKNRLKLSEKQKRRWIRKKKIFQTKLDNLQEFQKFFEPYFKLNDNVKMFIDMQLRHVKHCEWLPSEKEFALEFYYRSSKGYTHLRHYKHFSLPCETLISQWVNQLELRPGICKNLCDLLKVRIRSMTKLERECVLIWDEMTIKKWLEYNKKQDLVEGFSDFGGLGRFPEMVSQGLIFMLRGRRVNWKQIFCYYVAKNSVEG